VTIIWLSGLKVFPFFFAFPLGDALAQFPQARDGRIVNVVAHDGFRGGLFGLHGGVVIRPADLEMDDLPPLPLHFFGGGENLPDSPFEGDLLHLFSHLEHPHPSLFRLS